jgi:hypothetical protein
MTSGGIARCSSVDWRCQRPRAFLTPARSNPIQNPAYALRAKNSARIAARTMYTSGFRCRTCVATPATMSATITTAGMARRAGRGHARQLDAMSEVDN